MKLGLANIVTLYLLSEYTGKDAFMVLMVRILLGSFLQVRWLLSCILLPADCSALLLCLSASDYPAEKICGL
jgi:uncharacterized membrane protein